MPTNKNASIRYQTLDKCFSDIYHRYYIDDLIDRCNEALYQYNGIGGVSRRQIFEDMRYMESDSGWNIPLERCKDGRKVYYRYAVPDFTINEQPLTTEEAQHLETAILTLSRFKGFPCNEWFDKIISNLEWRFKLKRSDHQIIGFDQNRQFKGSEYLSPLIDAIVRQQVLRITYMSYKDQAVERQLTLHPYYLKEYNNRWFLLARDDGYHYMSNLALDRILSLSVAEDIPYIPNRDINFDTYFDEVIGVTIPDDETVRERIVLRFCARQFAYVKAKPLHPSQQILNEEEHLLSIEVRPNYELDYSILSLGPDVEVLEPADYREHIRQKIEDTLRKYTPVQNGSTPEL